MGRETKKTPRRRIDEKAAPTLSKVLRDLYLHGIEFCLFFSPCEGHPVFSKDQIISVLEKGEGERNVCELTKLCPSFSTLEDLLEKKVLVKQTELLVLKDADLRILSVSSIAGMAEGDVETGIPLWWDAPLPFVSWTGGRFTANRKAAEVLGGIPVPRGKGPEFLCETSGGKCFLFREIHPAVFLVDDVSEDMGNAKEMTWWAAVGKAFVSRLRGKGFSVEKTTEVPSAAEDERDEVLACVWDDNILGYLKVKDGKEF
ncbi:hypothetical protein C8D99_10411 [Aminivibrio pyruvatiphilus]|uniref:Uncharacterized protein n=1 Tax=Aminivibrio pyruvatiphilus TaxID=1005740 RepID=A0A4R8M8C6_9BACT|nr:hypothetical protein [Aminivibrio pyruvatiphilus]TDY61773.1 hypothetical protein C8D99_10411 [Aminivibrio pyruvatiphilus]